MKYKEGAGEAHMTSMVTTIRRSWLTMSFVQTWNMARKRKITFQNQTSDTSVIEAL